MVRIGIVGAGVAGVAAARETAGRGAKVTLFESATTPTLAKSRWPSLLEGAEAVAASRDVDSLARLDVQVKTNEPVISVEQGSELVTRHGRFGFDSVVLASGGRIVPEDFVGRHRPGFHVLADPRSFIALREALGEYTRVSLAGSGPLALDVMDRVSRKGVGVTVFAPSGIMGQRLGEGPRKRLEKALSDAGVSIVMEKPDRVAGVDAVEAVLAGGDVFPCQACIVVPNTEPNSLGVSVRLGRHGGVVVDGEMRSGRGGLFAAGACAEIVVGSTTLGSTLESSARMMGEAAGANSSGGHVVPRISSCNYFEVFGVGVVVAGLSRWDALLAGLDAVETSTDSMDSTCSLVYDRRSLRVWGVQIVGAGAGDYAQAAPLVVSGSYTLEDLAHQEFPLSTDISTLVEAAREGLKRGG